MKLLGTVGYLMFVRAATLVASALIAVVTARALGPAGRGAFALPALDVSVAVTFAAGLSTAAAYHLLNRDAGRPALATIFIATGSFVLAGLVPTAVMAWLNHSVWALPPACVQLASYAVYASAYGIYNGRGRPRDAATLNVVAYVLAFGAVAVAVLSARTPQAAVWAWAGAWAAIALVSAGLIVRELRTVAPEATSGARRFIRFAAKSGALNLAGLLNYRIDMFIVAALLPVTTLGIYTIALLGAESALSFTLAVGQATLPRTAETGRHDSAQLVARCVRNGLLLALVLALLAALVAQPIVRVTLGPAYLPALLPFYVLLPGMVIASSNSVISNYFVLNRGRAAVPFATAGVSSIVCAGLCFALIPRWGLPGAALSSTLGYAASQCLAIAFFCRDARIGLRDVLFVTGVDIAGYERLARRVTLRRT